MRKILVMLFLGISLSCYSQEFLCNPDYVYGSGVTDSAAVASLSMSIGVKVENEISYTIVEENRQISSKFVKNSGMNFSRFLNGTKSYYDNGIYYRYINKKEYINERLVFCKEFEQKAEEIDNLQVKHKLNLVLGYYYRAYSMLDDSLFIALTNNTYNSWKESLKHKAESTYTSGDYGNLFFNEKGVNGYWVVSNKSFKSVGLPVCLFAFEYENNGEWAVPSSYERFSDIKQYAFSTPNDDKFFDRCFIRSKINAINYRFIYEDEYGKIDVPDEWYFSTYRIINSRNLN